ncbi:hypothetical protein CHS0354_012957 [Potamilus streckersoni]|uniref:Uncharacterized protein n=1 Tax=Potamilus streckersoni TaxID=2493646 RepID=A0AAE0VYZ2_9BIVA|nr:hypothetical protein CHS0354_012957 [Potamilus streckersoni]
MKKTVFLIGLVGLCLAYPHLQVSEKDRVDNSWINQAASLSLGAEDIDERGCFGARVALIAQTKFTGTIKGDNPGENFQLDMAVITAAGKTVCCSSLVQVYDSGSITVTFCKCIK